MVANCAHHVQWVYNVIHTSIYEPLKMVFTAAHKTTQSKVFQYFVLGATPFLL